MELSKFEDCLCGKIGLKRPQTQAMHTTSFSNTGGVSKRSLPTKAFVQSIKSFSVSVFNTCQKRTDKECVTC